MIGMAKIVSEKKREVFFDPSNFFKIVYLIRNFKATRTQKVYKFGLQFSKWLTYLKVMT